MAGGLSSIVLDEDEGGLPEWARMGVQSQGALGVYNQGAFDNAVSRLNASAVEIPWNQIDEFRRRWDPEFNAAKQQFDAAMAAAQQSSQINQNLPWLRMAAGFAKPTKTGSFGESFGYGMEGLSGGMEEIQKQRLHDRQLRDKWGIDAANMGMQHALTGEQRDIQALQAISSLERARTLANRDPDTLQMYRWANDPNVPPEERARRMRFFEMRYGSSAVKNAGAMTSGDVTSPGVAQQVNAPLWKEAYRIAEQMNPPEAFEGQPLGMREQAVNEQALRIFNSTPKGIGARTTAAPGAPAAAAPARAAPAPSLAAVAPPAREEGPFAGYLTPPRTPAMPQGVVPGLAQKEGMKAFGKESEQRASTYLEKDVYPGITAADELRSTALIAKETLQKNPGLTGKGKPLLGEVGNLMMTLGIAPNIVQSFVNNQEIFRSQAMMAVLAKQIAQKGPQTESDALRMLQAGIDPSKPYESNMFLTRYMEAVADRLFERGKFFDAWSKRNNGQMAGSVEAWNRFNAENPVAKIIDGKVHFRKMRE